MRVRHSRFSNLRERQSRKRGEQEGTSKAQFFLPFDMSFDGLRTVSKVEPLRALYSL